MASKKKKAAPKKAAKKSAKKSSKKSVAVVPANAVGEPPPHAPVFVERPIGAVVADIRKAVDTEKAKANAWPGYYPEIAKLESELMYMCDPGSEFDRIANGWRVKIVEGGVVILGSGPSIAEAVMSYGQQIDHAMANKSEQEQAQARLAAAPEVAVVSSKEVVVAA